MNTLRPAGSRFRAEAIPLALAALLAVSLPAVASSHSGGGHSGGGHSSSHSGGGHSTRSGGGPHGSTGRTAHQVPGGRFGGHVDGRGHGDGRGHFDGHGHFFNGGGRIFFGAGFYDPFFFDFYYPFGYWGPAGYWGPDYDPYYASRPHEYYERERDDMGALDLDLSPAKTQVYVNGQYMGIVDNFDGWPDYLWLPQGTYDVVFYLEGYKTIARQVTVYPGNVLDLDDKMEPGPSTRPEDLAAKTHERRDQRLSEERDRGRRYDGDQGDDEGWRDRVRRDRGPRRDGGSDRGDYRGRPPAGDDSARGRLVLDVQPADASVYVDGRFVGTGSDLSMMRAGLPLAVGDHKLAIVRPGRKAEEKTFTVKAGEDVRLDVSLDANPG
jgi:hypothetical protein